MFNLTDTINCDQFDFITDKHSIKLEIRKPVCYDDFSQLPMTLLSANQYVYAYAFWVMIYKASHCDTVSRLVLCVII